MLNIRGSPPVTYNLNSLRRHYPVQVIGYYLSLLRSTPEIQSLVKDQVAKVVGK